MMMIILIHHISLGFCSASIGPLRTFAQVGDVVQNPSATDVSSAPWWLAVMYLVLFVIGLIGSSYFSGVETAVYSVSRLRLLVLESAGDRRAASLHGETSNMTRLISSLLIGNNAAINLVSFATTAYLTNCLLLGDVSIIALQAVFLTPVLVLIGEIIPKEFCRVYPERVLYKTLGVIRSMRIILTWTGLLPLVTTIATLMLRFIDGGNEQRLFSTRARMAALLREGVGTGVLSENQIDIADRALHIQSIFVREAMTRWTVVTTLRADVSRAEVQARRNSLQHSRYPVVDKMGRIIGIVSLIDLLVESPDTTVREVMQPAALLKPRDSIHTALEVLRSGTVHLAIVGTREQPIGLVSRKDLLDPLIGILAAA